LIHVFIGFLLHGLHKDFDLESPSEAESLNPAKPEEEIEAEAGESGRAGRRNKSLPARFS
jgi:hypothetical protein